MRQHYYCASESACPPILPTVISPVDAVWWGILRTT
jgi:hypothetical protein